MIGIAEESVRFAHSGPSQRFLRGLRPLVSVGPLFSGANASRHHLPRSIADKHLHFNHYDQSHNLLWHDYPAHKYSSGITAWRKGLLTLLRHDHHAHKCSRANPAWRRGASDLSSARLPCPQVPQWHPCVAKRSSDRSLARPPCPRSTCGQGRVAKGRKSVPLTGLRSGLRPVFSRRPYPQMPQWHPRGATASWCIG